MSAGIEMHPPASASLLTRAKERLARIKEKPNPIWARELQQSIRRGHTPAALMLVTGGSALLVTAVGGSLGVFRSPASIGAIIYQTFFSLAFFVVLLLGPALAANAIVAEREGRTWEAVLLTGMSPAEIARGKFLSALTAIGLYIVALAPVGAVSFLFGGVTASDVVMAFAYLFVFAALSVSFGLAVSSKMQRLGTAIVTTLLLAVAIAFTSFGTLGFGLSFGANELWPRIPQGSPVWLPVAYERATFGLDYLYFLFLLPIVGFGIPAWFFYEATIANLASASDDRSSGLKRWFLVSSAALAITLAILPFRTPSSPLETTLVGISVFTAFMGFSAFVFLGEPLGPSRRVRADWERNGSSAFVRFMGPGLIKTFQLVLLVGVLGLGCLTVTGALSIATGISTTDDYQKLALFTVHLASFFLFVAGFSAWMRARAGGLSGARITTVIVVFAAFIVPWLLAATAGAFTDYGEDALVIAAPSPFYVAVVLDAVGRTSVLCKIVASLVASAIWAVLGILAFFAGSARARQAIAAHEALLAETDRLLEAEDRAQAEAAGMTSPGESVEPSAP